MASQPEYSDDEELLSTLYPSDELKPREKYEIKHGWNSKEFRDFYLRPILTELACTTLALYVVSLVSITVAHINFEKDTIGSVFFIAFSEGLFFCCIPFLARKSSRQSCSYGITSVTFAQLSLQLSQSEGRNAIPQFLRCLYVIVMQLVGSVGGTYLASLSFPSSLQIGIARSAGTFLGDNVHPLSAFVVECVCTVILVNVILAVQLNEPRKSSFMIAFVYISAKLAAYPISGGSMNLARSFGSALLNNNWSFFWVHAIAPLVGSIIAAVIFLSFHVDILSYVEDHLRSPDALKL